MKNKVFSAMTFYALFLAGSVSLGQDFPTDKGSMILFGNILLSSMGGKVYESDGDRLTMITATPGLIGFISPGIGIGGELLFNRAAQGKESSTAFGIGPKVLLVIGGNEIPSSIKGSTYPYLGAAFLLLGAKYKYTITEWDWSGKVTETMEESSASGSILSASAGVLHMLSDAVGLSLECTYQLENERSGGESTSANKINLLIGITAFIY
ncbi:MAG: hypothetical protein ONB25_12550 [candidate division KSB1 bacterium]|nr:hypothetical protein [candidate division KSB1 bacterium]